MTKIGIFYGSTTGNTQNAAFSIAKELNISNEDIIEISKATPEKMMEYDILLLGSSTWGYGDLQDDWQSFMGVFSSMKLSGKKVAVFGTGDSYGFSDTFCDSIGIIAEAAQAAGAEIIGNSVDISGYSAMESKAVVDGDYVGLALDQENEGTLTDERISAWTEGLKNTLGI